MNKELSDLLKEELDMFDSAVRVLNHSYEECKKIRIKKNYSPSEFEKIEALCSRFSRVSDMLIQKVLRVIDEVEFLDTGTPRDRMNRAEKRGFVENTDTLVKIRKLRNEIVHEYVSEMLKNIFPRVIKLCPQVFAIREKIKKYCQPYLKR